MPETVFREVRHDLGGLINLIKMGEIGLPDIQRPFVWKNAKVRDLFDSMYNGYPVGYLLLWENAFAGELRRIGSDHKQKPPRLLVVDGQQRLTSLYAVVQGVPVVRDNYASEIIEIAFNPLLERFEVADAAIRRDRSYIPNISILWDNDTDIFQVVEDYLDALRVAREVEEQETRKIKRSIRKLSNLLSFPFTSLELSSEVDEEQVSEVFVRINSKGTPLNQADFILTLMSVFWDEGRADLERFCQESRQPSTGAASAFNHFIQPDPDQLLRVGIGLGFKRARLQYVYSILRGKDLETEEFSEARRDEQFEVLKRAQAKALDLQYWHDFFRAIELGGFKGGRMITSQTTLLFTYVLYLIGRTELGVEEKHLRRAIARWFFMASLTGRYTGSPESAFEFDLAGLRPIKDAEEFVAHLDRICEATLTNDFWAITLPTDLAKSSARSPSLFAYYAALVRLDAKALFSEHKVADLLDPSVHAKRAAAERHHLFPKAYLQSIGITESRETNQIANYALAEWADNAEIGDSPPVDYVEELQRGCDAKDLERMYYWHALPDGWERMNYQDFLIARRELIAKVIGEAYKELREPSTQEIPSLDEVSVETLVEEGEGTHVEFKSTLRANLHTGQKDARLEMACIKTVAGFLNGRGGTLVIGVSDDGEPVGLGPDSFPNEDKLNLHLVNLLRSRIGADKMIYVHPRFEDYDGERILAVECLPSRSPVYVRDGNEEHFFIRTGASTTELVPSQMESFIRQRFGS